MQVSGTISHVHIKSISNHVSLRAGDVLCGNRDDVVFDCLQLARMKAKQGPLQLSTPISPHDVLPLSVYERANAYMGLYDQLGSEEKCNMSDFIVHTGDDPRNTGGWCTWSAKSSAIPTIRKSSSFFFSPHLMRHVLLMELYMSMGYPSFDWLAHPLGVPTYKVFYHPTAYNQAKQALGNSFHVAQVGVFMGVLLSCCTWKR